MNAQNDTTDSVITVSLTPLQMAEMEVARLKAEAAAAEAEAAQARINSVCENLKSLGFDDATIVRVLAALNPPVVSGVARIGRNGQPQALAMRRDGTVNTTLTGEGLVAHNLADGTRTLAEIATEMGVAPRSGMPYTASYVKSWLTSGANGKKGYWITFEGNNVNGRVTSHAPVTA